MRKLYADAAIPFMPVEMEFTEVSVIAPGGKVIERICESEGARRARIAALKDDAAMLSALLNEMCVECGTMSTCRKLAREIKAKVAELE